MALQYSTPVVHSTVPFHRSTPTNSHTHIDVSAEVGHTFAVSLIAVDQVYRPADATIQGLLCLTVSNLIYGQMTTISNTCTSVNFIITPSTIFASDGPCKKPYYAD